MFLCPPIWREMVKRRQTPPAPGPSQGCHRFKAGRENGDGAERSWRRCRWRRGWGSEPWNLVIFAQKCGRPPRPGTCGEAGREKPLGFQCRSNLSNLSNQKLEREKGRLLCSCRIFSTRFVLAESTALRLRSPRADTVARLDRANNGGHYSRPASLSQGWTT
jgi:hypothetical protein